MRKFITAAIGALLLAAPASPAMADGTSGSVFWQSIIGIITPPVAGTNNVGPIVGAGEPWTTLGGQAYVDLLDNRVQFDVRGLVLAGGASIGTPGTVTEVEGTLVCGSASFSTPSVDLSAQGNAEFSGSFTSPPTSACSPTNVAFLITIPSNGHWIANGAVRVVP
jgi:hypothetical protein